MYRYINYMVFSREIRQCIHQLVDGYIIKYYYVFTHNIFLWYNISSYDIDRRSSCSASVKWARSLSWNRKQIEIQFCRCIDPEVFLRWTSWRMHSFNLGVTQMSRAKPQQYIQWTQSRHYLLYRPIHSHPLCFHSQPKRTHGSFADTFHLTVKGSHSRRIWSSDQPQHAVLQLDPVTDQPPA